MFGNAAFAAANVEYGEFMAEPRLDPHATNDGVGSGSAPFGPSGGAVGLAVVVVAGLARVVVVGLTVVVVFTETHWRSAELALLCATRNIPSHVTCFELPAFMARFTTDAPEITIESIPTINNAANIVMIETRRTRETESRTTATPLGCWRPHALRAEANTNVV